MSNLARERSQFAYGCVSNVWNPYVEAKKNVENKKIDCKDNNLSDANKKICKDLADKYKVADNYQSYVIKIPMMILTNGLGATFAFVYSKKKDGNAYDLIYKQVDEWLQKNYKNGQCDINNECYKDEKNKKCEDVDLVKWIICLESPEYRAVTNEVLALFQWLKRFADGMIEGEGDGD